MAPYLQPRSAIPFEKSAHSRNSIRQDGLMKNAKTSRKPISHPPPAGAAIYHEAHKNEPVEQVRNVRKNTGAAPAPNLPRRSARIAAKQLITSASKPDLLPKNAPRPSRITTAKTNTRLQHPPVKTRTRARANPQPQENPPTSTSAVPAKSDQRTRAFVQNPHRPRQKQIVSGDKSKKPKRLHTTTSAPKQQDHQTLERVSPWLDSLEAPELPSELEIVEDGIMSPQQARSAKQTDASPSVGSFPASSDNTGSNKTKESQKREKEDTQFYQKLIYRWADPWTESPGDEIRDSLKSSMDSVPQMFLPLAQLEDVVKLAERFAKKCRSGTSNTNGYEIFENFRHDVNQYLPNHKLTTLTDRDFGKDLDLCKRNGSNEAILQRTVLTSSIDRWRLSNKFDYTCESGWKLSPQQKVPSMAKDIITPPMPDLTLSFHDEAVRNGIPKAYPIHPEIRQYVHPDAELHRFFPFFFMEAKKDDASLRRAVLYNMSSASQALHNIHVCMKHVGIHKEYFDKVRVFSISINAGQLEARIHRAIDLQPGNRLQFIYQILKEKDSYTRESVNTLVQTILRDYAEPVLLPILQQTYKSLVEAYISNPDANNPASSNGERGQKRTNNGNQLTDLEEQSEEEQLKDGEGNVTDSSHPNDTQNATVAEKKSRKKAKSSNNARQTRKSAKEIEAANQSFGASGITLDG